MVKYIPIAISLIALALAGLALTANKETLGNAVDITTYTNRQVFQRAVTFQSTTTLSGNNVFGGSATTSTDFNLMCWQVNPTSTATNVRVIPATTTIPGYSAFYMQFGTCP